MTTSRHRVAAWGLAVGIAAALALVASPVGLAHADLVATTPGSGVVVPRSPEQVVLRFSEPVETAFGSIRVFDEQARRVDDGRTTRPAPNEVATRIAGDLAQGTYTVAWRAVSADSHPVRGAFVFHVGTPGSNPGGIATEIAGEDGSEVVDGVFAVVRYLLLTAILVAAGIAAALAVWVPRRSDVVRARTRLWATTAAAAAVVAVATAASVGLQGAAAAGLGLDAAVRPSLASDVLDTRFGQVAAGRVFLAVALLAVALVAWRGVSRRERHLAVVACLLGAAVAVTPALAGHAQVEGPVAVVADAAHVEAAAVWVGGLTALTLLLAWSAGSRWTVAGVAVPAFSRVAVAAVATLLVAGVVNGLVEVGSFDALWETAYGRMVLAKVALVVPLLALGAYNNRKLVPRLRHGNAGDAHHRALWRSAGAELALMAVVVGVTTALVAEPPPRSQASDKGPASIDTTVGPFDLNLVVDPARQGANEMHLYLLDRSGQPAAVAETRVAASLPAASLGPLRLTTVKAGPGHYVVPAATFPLPGAWTLAVDVRRGDFDLWSTTLQLSIRKDT
jgi:copper transport protein